MTDLEIIIKAGIMSRETVRIALMIAAINDLEVKPADIIDAYLQVNDTEQVWTAMGSEFGKDARKTAVTVKALYGLNPAGASFRSHLVSYMEYMGYVP